MVFKLIVWACIGYGITQIITESTLLAPLRTSLKQGKRMRWLGELLSCILCISVWVSAILSIFVVSPSMDTWQYLNEPVYISIPFTDVLVNLATFRGAFLDAMLGSTIIWFVHLLEGKLMK